MTRKKTAEPVPAAAAALDREPWKARVAPATELLDVPLEEIDTHSGNPRVDVGDVTELAASIEQQGILEPLLVAPVPAEHGLCGTCGYVHELVGARWRVLTDHTRNRNTETEEVCPGSGQPIKPGSLDTSRFVLLAGHRRLAAAQVAGLQEVPCIVRHDLTDPARQLETMLVENLQRADLTPVEEAVAYQALLEFPGYTMAKIAKATGRSNATVKHRLALTKLPDKVRGKIQAGQISLTEAAAIAQFADDPEAVKKLESAAGTNNFKWYLEQAQTKRARDRLREKEVAKLEQAGARVVDLQKLYDSDDAWTWVDPEGDLDDVRQTPEQHATCPGAAVAVDVRFYGKPKAELRYVCLQPELHPELVEDSPEAASAAAEDRARREAEQRARIEQREQLAAAAVVRRQHVVDTGTLLDPTETRDLLAGALLKLVSNTYNVDKILAVALGDNIDPKTVPANITGQSIGVLAVLVDLVANGAAEDALAGEHGWPRHSGWYSDKSAAWRQRLVEVYGYEWTDIEAELNTEPPPAIVDVNLPDDDVEPDEDDDVDEDVEEDELEAVAP